MNGLIGLSIGPMVRLNKSIMILILCYRIENLYLHSLYSNFDNINE